MDKTNWWKIAVIVIAALALFWGGFFLGRSRMPEKITNTIIKYVEMPPIRDSIPYPVPYKVVEPVDTADVIKECIEKGLYSDMFPVSVIRDSVYVTSKDTSAALKDWATERYYQETLFDVDTLGKCTVTAAVKYNRLMNLGYEYVPIQKQTETQIRTARKFLPYIGAGLNTSGHYMAQGGMFFNQDLGLGVQYDYDGVNKKSSVGALFLYMF